MVQGSDEAYRNQLVAAGNKELVYQFGNDYHGKTKKRAIEGPQICTAKEMRPEVIRGKDFVAVRQTFQYKTAAPAQDRLEMDATDCLPDRYAVFYFDAEDRHGQ